MKQQNTEFKRNFDLASFKRASRGMISKNDEIYGDYDYLSWRSRSRTLKDYKPEEIDNIINSGSLSKQRELSRNYFLKDGLYRAIVLYYANLLKCVSLLIPKVGFGKKLSDKTTQKRYYKALDYLDEINPPILYNKITTRALTDGAYYGLISSLDKGSFVLIDLPASYCQSRFRDTYGRDIIEFNVNYFDHFADEDTRNQVLEIYPKEVTSFYRRYVEALFRE